jgi:hypothetical protein
MAKKKSEDDELERSVLQEGREGIQLAREAYPAFLDLKTQYDPQFARTEVATADARAQAQARGVAQYGQQYRESLLAASPEVAKANAALTGQLDDLGPSALERELTTQAGDELRRGGALTPEESRQANQGARAAWSARGLGTGGQAAVSEVLNRVQYSNQRLGQRREFASGIEAQSQQRRAGDRAFANNTFNTLGAFWDPYQRMYGTGGSQVSGQVQGAAEFQPYLRAAGDVGQGNQAAALGMKQMDQQESQFSRGLEAERENFMMNRDSAANIAAGNNKSAMMGAGIGAAALILAAFI